MINWTQVLAAAVIGAAIGYGLGMVLVEVLR